MNTFIVDKNWKAVLQAHLEKMSVTLPDEAMDYLARAWVIFGSSLTIQHLKAGLDIEAALVQHGILLPVQSRHVQEAIKATIGKADLKLAEFFNASAIIEPTTGLPRPKSDPGEPTVFQPLASPISTNPPLSSVPRPPNQP